MGTDCLLIGVDIGSSGAKAAAFTETGWPVAIAREEYEFMHPKVGWSEIDPDLVWRQVIRCLQRITGDDAVAGKDIRGIGLSVIGETIMPIGKDGNPIAWAIEAVDGRDNGYAQQVAHFQAEPGIEWIFAHTSYPLSSLASAVKILWWRMNRPDIFEKAHRFATFQDFVVHKLTGNFAIDLSMASRTMLYDLHEHDYSPPLLSRVGIDAGQLSQPVEATTVVGKVTVAAARETGLPEGIPVSVGAHDQACASLGVGVTRLGIAMNGSGSVEAVVLPCAEPISDLSMLQRGQGSQSYVISDLYLAIGFHLTSGALIRWYRDQLAADERVEASRTGTDPYDLMTANASSSCPGANGLLVLPHWVGSGTGWVPPLNPRSRGVIVGLTISHTKCDLARAFFEGVTLETRHIIESMESSTGVTLEELRVTGGATKSAFWLQLKADVTGKRIRVPEVTEASLLGAALLAGVGTGVYGSIEDAVARAVRLGETIEPNQATKSIYDDVYGVYERLYSTLIPVFDKLSEISR